MSIKRYRCCGPSDDMFTMYSDKEGLFMYYRDYLADVEQREKAHAAEVERLKDRIIDLSLEIEQEKSSSRVYMDKVDNELAAKDAEIERMKAASKPFVIRFDGPPGPESGRFVEAEDINGHSINIGKWVQDGEYWLLVIYPENQDAEIATLKNEAEKERNRRCQSPVDRLHNICMGIAKCPHCGFDFEDEEDEK